MSTIVIKVDGVDITDDVVIREASFQSLVNGNVGQARLRVKDTGQTYSFTTGDSLTLDVDSVRIWGGYVMGAKKVYALSVIDTSPPYPLTRMWEINGADYNILFNKRIVWKESDPTGKLDFKYDADTYDDTIINDIFDNYLSVSGDGLTRTGVTRIAKAILDVPGKTHHGSVASASYTWKQMMDRVARATGGVYYISPDKVLTYVDVETATSDYDLTDNPSTGGGPVTPIFEDTFTRTVAQWTGWGGNWTLAGGTHRGAVNGSEAVIDAGSFTFPATNTDIPAAPTDFDIYLDIKTSPLAGNGSQYWYVEYGGVWFDTYPDTDPTSSPYNMGVELGGNGPVGTVDTLVSVNAEEWWTLHVQQLAGVTGLNFWKASDPEPGGWLLTHTSSGNVSFKMEVDANNVMPAYIDNLRIIDPSVGGGPSNDIGYQSFTLLENGSNLVNDMFVWGAGQGSDSIVNSRTQDSASIAEHGRWQLGLFTGALYRQASADIIADSYVYGTPQSHRGGKDDAVSFNCRVFEPLFTAGQVVDVTCDIYVYNDALPIRSMTVTFANPTEAIFDLVLGHLIDEPVWISEYANFPPIDDGCPKGLIKSPSGQCIPAPEDDGGEVPCNLEETFNRTRTYGWGASEIDSIGWDGGAQNTSFSIVPGHATYDGPGASGYAAQTLSLQANYATKPVNVVPTGTLIEMTIPTAGGDGYCLTFSLVGNGRTYNADLHRNGTDLDVEVYGNHGSGYDGFGINSSVLTSVMGSPFYIRLKIESTTVSWKFWKSSDPEPGSFTLTVNPPTGDENTDGFGINAVQMPMTPLSIGLDVHYFAFTSGYVGCGAWSGGTETIDYYIRSKVLSSHSGDAAYHDTPVRRYNNIAGYSSLSSSDVSRSQQGTFNAATWFNAGGGNVKSLRVIADPFYGGWNTGTAPDTPVYFAPDVMQVAVWAGTSPLFEDPPIAIYPVNDDITGPLLAAGISIQPWVPSLPIPDGSGSNTLGTWWTGAEGAYPGGAGDIPDGGGNAPILPVASPAYESVIIKIVSVSGGTWGTVAVTSGPPSPNAGPFCETLVHSGGTSFTTTKAFFAGSLELWVNGHAQSVLSYDGATASFTTSFSLAATDVVHVCYNSNGDPIP